jgi:cell cycle checkpoint control protein RAD9A
VYPNADQVLEILKHPLRTAVSVKTEDFEKFNAQEKMHIVINVRDFKAIVTHADTLRTSISATYSVPTRPLQFSYGEKGIYCEFTLMTAGESRGTPAPSVPPASVQAMNASAAQSFSRTSASSEDTNSEISNVRTDMPPPRMPASRASARRTLKPTGTASTKPSRQASDSTSESDSLFVQQDEDDNRWDPMQYGDQEDTLGWDANADNVCDLSIICPQSLTAMFRKTVFIQPSEIVDPLHEPKQKTRGTATRRNWNQRRDYLR